MDVTVLTPLWLLGCPQAPIQLRIHHRQDPEHQGGHGETGTPPTLGGHPQLGLRRLLAPAANVFPSFTAVGAPSMVDPQGPDVLGDGTPNILLLVPFLLEDGPDGGIVEAVEPVDSEEEEAEKEDIDNSNNVIQQYFQ
ncbi:hypothetical protein NDU88_003367 [Pleurodeles waltl]|uniref:Uncharacterized protein n=1 Tax=Pleurodeles waltl TaxID=8319 RepID=A0AAV7T5X8_PLEWA|nr:hypothetical protein NDU88_003367 [Pleurodeles waltl]